MKLNSEESGTVLISQAGMLLRDGKFEQAESIYRRLINAGLTSPSVLSNLAVICKRTKRGDEAMSLLARAVESYPDLPELRFNLGNSHMAMGDWAAAVQSFRDAISIRPDFPDALYNLGNAYRKIDELEAAIACYNKALNLKPDFPEAQIALGVSLAAQNLMRAAILALNKGLDIIPNHSEGLYSLGMAYQSEGDLNRSAQAFTKCLNEFPNCLLAIHRLDRLYRQMGDKDSVIANYQKALSLDPQTAEACCELGIFFQETGDIQRALHLFETSLSLKPDYVEAQLSYAMSLLQIEEFAKGWDLYDWRLQKKSPKLYYQCNSHWIAGKFIDSLFLAGEQGIGDQIMFCSIIPDTVKNASAITAQVDTRLVALMSRSMPHVRFVDSGFIPLSGQFDACIPMGSLCRHYRRSRSAYSLDQTGYLVANSEQSLELRRQLVDGPDLLIGISWESRRQDVDLEKSIPLKALALSLARPGVALVSLQYGDTRKELAALKEETGIRIRTVESIDNFKDIDGLAALIDCCDLIVSASNVTIHLAGGLSKPTWMLLKKVPDWRWGLHENRTWWYPSVSIYRQSHRGQWDEPLQQINQDLGLYIESKARSSAPNSHYTNEEG